MENIRETCCCHDYLILRRGQWIGEIFVLEKGCPGDACGMCCGGPKFQTSLVFSGRAQVNSFCAVFGVGAAFVWFVVNQCFHADQYKGMPIVIVGFVDMCICR